MQFCQNTKYSLLFNHPTKVYIYISAWEESYSKKPEKKHRKNPAIFLLLLMLWNTVYSDICFVSRLRILKNIMKWGGIIETSHQIGGNSRGNCLKKIINKIQIIKYRSKKQNKKT